jgi:hypothetical protein
MDIDVGLYVASKESDLRQQRAILQHGLKLQTLHLNSARRLAFPMSQVTSSLLTYCRSQTHTAYNQPVNRRI